MNVQPPNNHGVVAGAESEADSLFRPVISIVTPCYNEQGNIHRVVSAVRDIFQNLPAVAYEHIFADNCSTDETLPMLRELARTDKRIKIIANARNFGASRSVFNALLASKGNAAILLAADLEDPAELIPLFIEKWREGNPIVFGVREKRSGSKLMALLRKIYYRVLNAVSEDELLNDAGDFVLIDQRVIEVLRHVNHQEPYLRGILTSLGFPYTGIKYCMSKRTWGKSKTNPIYLIMYSLNALVAHSRFPIKLATLGGLVVAFFSLLYAVVTFAVKLFVGSSAPPGLVTVAIGVFFLGGCQLFTLGFIGEYIASMHRLMKNHPLVIERERINFDGNTGDEAEASSESSMKRE